MSLYTNTTNPLGSQRDPFGFLASVVRGVRVCVVYVPGHGRFHGPYTLILAHNRRSAYPRFRSPMRPSGGDRLDARERVREDDVRQPGRVALGPHRDARLADGLADRRRLEKPRVDLLREPER